MSDENVTGHDSADQNAATGNAPVSGDDNAAPGQGIPKSRFDAVNAKRKEAENALAEMADELAQDVPESMRDLIPATLPPVERVRWIRNALAKGLFSQPAPSGPDSKRPGGKPPTNFENMTPAQMRAMGYKN